METKDFVLGFAAGKAQGGGGGGVSDNDLLFHFDNDFKNSGSYPAVFYFTDGLAISNEQSKFGGHSLKCAYNQVKDNVALDRGFAFGNNDFTLDFWMYPLRFDTGTRTPVAFTYRSLAFYINENECSFNTASSNSYWGPSATATGLNISLNTWHHVAVTRNEGTVFLFLNGKKIAETTVGDSSIAPITAMTVGSNTYSSGDRRFEGYLDELRLKIGQAVWTSDFTPPTEPYT